MINRTALSRVACALTFLLISSVGAPTFARALIGISVIDADNAAAEIIRVRPGYPAERAGLEVGDLILEVDGRAPSGAEETAALISSRDDGPTLLSVRRGNDDFTLSILPWPTPDPERDAALFPYPSGEDAASITAMRAVVADRDYDVVSVGAIFTLARSFNAETALLNRRVAFRARIINCDALAGGPATLYQPSRDPLYEFRPAQSLLFDPNAAEAERLKCEAYMDARGLDLSSPVVVVYGRFVEDNAQILSSGGAILLVDAMLFDDNHVSLGAQVIGFIDVLERVARAFQ